MNYWKCEFSADGSGFGFEECEALATHVRHWSFIRGGAPTKTLCTECSKRWRVVYGDLEGGRVDSIVWITPGSDEHCTLDAAFYVLACGLHTPAELRKQNDEAKARNRRAA